MEADTIRRIAVIGAGQMGRGIAQVAASTGIEVLLSDLSAEVAGRAKDAIGGALERLVEKGKLAADARAATLEKIKPVSADVDLAGCGMAIEAVTEQYDLKVGILKNIDAALDKDAILASNTSSISITKLAATTQRADRVVGMHFMNPVPLMKLVEIVKGVQTSAQTYATTRDLAVKLGKTVITSNDAPGFLVNRVLIPLLNEAMITLQEGVGSAEDIDTGAKLGLNHPMGPLELADLIGLDTVLAIANVLTTEIGDPKYRPPVILKNLVAAGWLGKKTKRGFYHYDDKGQKVVGS